MVYPEGAYLRCPKTRLNSIEKMANIPREEWTVEFHPAFEAWISGLVDDGLFGEILAHVGVLQVEGPSLGRPYVDRIKGSKFRNMKELRVQYRGEPWRILFAFDPDRKAVVLVGGNKASDKRWYKTNVAIADQRFEEHLSNQQKETVGKRRPVGAKGAP